MKRIILIIAFVAIATTAHAGWFKNFNLFGGNHHHHRNGQPVQTYPEPNPPVSVPEPGNLLLLGSGLVALGAWKRMKR